jgi:hypothetical protein
VLHRWRKEFRQGPGNAFSGQGQRRWSEGRIAELERKIRQQTLEIDFFERVLAAHQRRADAAGIEWKSAVYYQVQEAMNAGGGLTIRRMLKLGRVSRSGFYRCDPEHKLGADRDLELRDAIQRIALEWPCYGWPRITEQLRRQGWTVKPDLVSYRVSCAITFASFSNVAFG